jgi:probable selenium-dependent hydroxylase accessory protein YqeC
MFALADALRLTGQSVVTSATTRVWRREAERAPRMILASQDHPDLKEIRVALAESGHLFVGRPLPQTEKAGGLPTRCADRLFRVQEIDHLILEADGAAGRPVKVPGPGEPVVPASATLVIAMMGLDALGRPFGPESVFRFERFQTMTDLPPGRGLDPKNLACAFVLPEGVFKGSPEGARRVVFLNKQDLLADQAGARELAGLILERAPFPLERIVIGSLKEDAYTVIRRSP